MRNFTRHQAMAVTSGLALLLGSACGVQSLEIGEGAAFAIASEAPDDFADEVTAVLDDRELDLQAHEAAFGDRSLQGVTVFEPCNFRRKREMVLAYYDFDGDRHLDQEELDALHLDMGEGAVTSKTPSKWARREVRRAAYRRLRWVFDTNDDGTLSQAERSAFVRAMELRCAAHRRDAIQAFDEDGDGDLSPIEIDKARDALSAERQAERAALLQAFDTNADGKLDDAERWMVREERLKALRERAATVRLRYDATQDGRLDKNERAALRRELLARLGAPPPRSPSRIR